MRKLKNYIIRVAKGSAFTDSIPMQERWTIDVYSMMLNLLVVAVIGMVICWAAGWLEAKPLLVVFFISGFALVGKYFLMRNQWKIASYFPTVMLFGMGVYGSIEYGTGSFLLVLYALSILCAALLQGIKTAWVVTISSIVFHMVIVLIEPNQSISLVATSLISLVMMQLAVVVLLSYTTRELRRSLAAAQQTNRKLNAEIERRNQIEQSLREREMQLRNLTDNMMDLVFEVDAFGIIQYTSPSCQAVVGYSQEELIGKPAEVFIYHEDVALITSLLSDMVKDRATRREEVRVRHGNGSTVLLEAMGKAVFDMDGDLTGFVVGCRDITERKAAEEGLRLSEEKFSKAFHTSPDAVSINRLVDGLYLEINEGFTHLLGYTSADITGKTSLQLMIWVDEQDRMRLVKGLRESGAVNNMEARFRRKNGEIGTGLLSARQIDVVGERCILSITRDITDRKMAEMALQESEGKFRNIVQSSPLGMHLYRLDENDRLIFMDANPAADAILGVSNAQFIGKTIEEAFPALVGTDVPDQYRRVCREGATWLSEQVNYEDNQIKGAYEVRAFKTGVATMTAMFQDITERKKAEETVMNISRGVSAETGQTFFISLVDHLSRTLKADTVFIGELVDEDKLKTVAVFSNGKITDNSCFSKVGTPCELAIERGSAILMDVAARFPKSNFQKNKIKHYIGAALYDSNNKPTGCISLLFKQPVSNPKLVESTLKIFGVRAAAELERQRIENALMDSEKRFRGLIENSADGVAVLNESGEILYVSPAIHSLLGYSTDEAQGINIFAMMHPDEIEINRRLFDRLVQEPKTPITGQLRIMHQDGSWRWLEVMGVNSLQEPAIQGVVINFRDISFRVTAEQELKKLNRSLQAISQCNLSMVQMTDEMDLLQEICRITVEVGGYPSSWIAYIEKSPLPVLRPVAQFGFSQSYEGGIPLSGSIDPKREEPPAKVLRLREPVIVKDVINSPCKTPWCKDAIQRGFRAMIVLPLFYNTEEFGSLMIYAADADSFEGDEYILLSELASDLSYGIHALRTRSERDRAIRQIERTSADLEMAYDATLEGWARALEMRERETAGHSRRVVEMTLELAQAAGVKEAELVHIRRGALLHDIGKMGMPDNILLKPSSLSGDEWIVMRQHPVFAYKLLNNIPYLRSAMDIPYCHHESWDGSGYPRGLKGEQIPVAARIFAVVDVWDALLSERPYRPSWPKEEVIHYLDGQSGKQFDPRIVRIFIDQVLARQDNGF